jgi:phosphatidate cytidylyltransferase
MILVFLACHEYNRMLSVKFHRNGFWLAYFWLGFQWISYFATELALKSSLDVYILLLVVAVEAIIWGKDSGRWMRASLMFSGVLFLSVAGISLMGLYRPPFQTVFAPRFDGQFFSQLGIVTVCSAVFLCDTAAYFAGSLWGKHHFTRISPKKTIEGLIAGFSAATIAGSLGWYFFASDSYPLFIGVAMGMLIGVFAQAGDLLVSLMKRFFRVKDASDIIPGHGGVLDRFDSLFFTAPVLSLFFLIVVKTIG